MDQTNSDALLSSEASDASGRLVASDALRDSPSAGRRLVHRQSPDEVFITSPVRIPGVGHAFALRPPLQHPLFRPEAGGALNPLLFVEALRQGGILLGHESRGIPLDHKFVFQAITAAFPPSDEGLLSTTGAPIMLTMQLGEAEGRAGRGSLRLTVEGWCGDRRFAEASATFRSVSHGAYMRLRAGRSTTTVEAKAPATPPEPLPRQPAYGVSEEYLRVDHAHPTFFDHDVDHLPGLLLIQGALNAAGVASADCWDDLRAFRLTFLRYAELHEPTLLSTTSHGDRGLRVVDVHISQVGQLVAVARVEVAPS